MSQTEQTRARLIAKAERGESSLAANGEEMANLIDARLERLYAQEDTPLMGILETFNVSAEAKMAEEHGLDEFEIAFGEAEAPDMPRAIKALNLREAIESAEKGSHEVRYYTPTAPSNDSPSSP